MPPADSDDVLRLRRAFAMSDLPDPGRFRRSLLVVLAAAAADSAEFLPAGQGGRVELLRAVL
ncbi:hypothetical protein [Streptomyces sp. B1-3]|uniref:hypothetical protein n=1 Tax=Streptomyces sp. B1-3 TaxID=3141453 RepID=UPI003D2C8C0C